MKKLTALVLCFGMMFSVAACAGPKVDDKALNTLEASVQKYSKLNSGSYSLVLDLTSDEKKAKVQLSGDFIASKDKPQLSANLSLEAEGQKIDNYMQLFLKDDSLYASILGISKEKISLKDLMKSANLPSTSTKTDTFKLNKDDMKPYLKEASLKGNDLNIVFDVDKINKLLYGVETPTKSKAAFKTLSMKATLKDGFLENAVITLDVSDTGNKKIQTINGTLTLNMKNMNNVKTINFPDLSDYKESGSALNK